MNLSLQKIRHQNGAAVITAILVVALAATAASFMMWQNHLWLRQVENLENQDQARWTARTALQWGMAILDDDKREVDHEGEQWAAALPPLAAENGEITGYIKDEQGHFNLNNLVRNSKLSQEDVVILTRLMIALEINPDLINALVDWMDADSEVSFPGGAEDGQYLGLEPPYRTANRMLADVDELNLIQGFDQETIRKLKPFVTALPAATFINVNTAPAEVLVALCSGLQLSDAKTLVQRRTENPFNDKADFKKQIPQGVQARDEDYNVNSRYFKASAWSRSGRVNTAYQALLARQEQGKSKIVWLRAVNE